MENFDLQAYINHHIFDSHYLEIPFLSPFYLGPYLSVHGLTVICWSTILIWIFCVLYKKNDPVPRGFTNFLEVLVVFIRDDISIAMLGEKDGLKFTPLFCTFFFFILGLNLIGLIPHISTATANINVTGALAFITLLFMIFGSIFKLGPVGFIKAFIPSGIPWPIAFLLFPI